jgi:oxygen-independent coproporphyrinogen-3 oxidase
VSQAGVRTLVRDWIQQDDRDWSRATHGVWLTEDDRRRRTVLLSLLQVSGLSTVDYSVRFGREVEGDFPDLHQLCERGWAIWQSGTLRLTAEGLALSDAIGPWLYAPARRRALEEFAPA